MTHNPKHSKINRNENQLNRRQFIKKAGLLTAGAVGSLGLAPQGTQSIYAGQTVPGKMTYRSLGRTGLNISVVVAGEMDHLPMHERAYEL